MEEYNFVYFDKQLQGYLDWLIIFAFMSPYTLGRVDMEAYASPSQSLDLEYMTKISQILIEKDSKILEFCLQQIGLQSFNMNIIFHIRNMFRDTLNQGLTSFTKHPEVCKQLKQSLTAACAHKIYVHFSHLSKQL